MNEGKGCGMIAPETIKQEFLVDGISAHKELEITIPCKPAAGPDRITPRYEVIERNGKVLKARWTCPYCERHFKRAKSCHGHMGLIPDRKHNCPVLRKQEVERRIK